jgi:hypothetical protein
VRAVPVVYTAQVRLQRDATGGMRCIYRAGACSEERSNAHTESGTRYCAGECSEERSNAHTERGIRCIYFADALELLISKKDAGT